MEGEEDGIFVCTSNQKKKKLFLMVLYILIRFQIRFCPSVDVQCKPERLHGLQWDASERRHQCWGWRISAGPPGAESPGCETQRGSGRRDKGVGRAESTAITLEVALRLYEPVEHDPAQLCLYTAQQLQLEEVLTQAIGAPVGGAHAAETGVAAKRHRHVWVQHPGGGNARQATDTHMREEGEEKEEKDKTEASK